MYYKENMIDTFLLIEIMFIELADFEQESKMKYIEMEVKKSYLQLFPNLELSLQFLIDLKAHHMVNHIHQSLVLVLL